MNARKLLELRQSEIRGRLTTLAETDSTPETETEIASLSTEYRQGEGKLQAMIISSDAPELVETRDSRQDLFDRASVGDLVFGLLNGRSTTGAMLELQTEYGLSDNELHIRQLRQDVETRAVTPAPGNVGQNAQPIIPYVFPDSMASFIGVDMPTVGVGEAVFPVLTKDLDVRTPAENAAAAETTGTFSAEVLSPSRLQAAFFYSREDRARFSGMDSALRENLSMGLSDGLDQQILAGTNGLLNGTVLANHNVTTVTTFDLYMAGLAYGRVDGRYASTAAAIRLVMGAHSYGHAGRVYRNTSVDRTALDRLMDITSGVRVSAHVPAAGSNRQNVLIRLGNNRDMVAPVWENIALIPDEITLAANGQIKLTAVMLHAIKLLRAMVSTSSRYSRRNAGHPGEWLAGAGNPAGSGHTPGLAAVGGNRLSGTLCGSGWTTAWC